MKRNLILLLFWLPVIIEAQVPDRLEQDCQGNTETVHSVLQQKVLLVISAGYDCSICTGEAPAVQQFASDNKNTIRVWGAMRYKYAAMKGDCNAANAWKNTYSWNNVFVFPDTPEYWKGSGTPFYQVIDPEDSAVAYSGYSFTDAKNKALEIAALMSTRPVPSHLVKVHAANALLTIFTELDLSGAKLEFFDMTGRKIELFIPENELHKHIYKIYLPVGATKGVYAGSMQTKQGTLRLKFMLQ